MLRLIPGQILFQRSKEQNNYVDAIRRSVVNECNIRMDHVALAYSANSVVHAVSEQGVIETDIKDFIAGADVTVIMKVNQPERIAAALDRASQWIGRPYNASYYPDTDGFYCSELIVKAFDDYFSTHPMSFIDHRSGEIIPFWLDYFAKLAVPIPHNQNGSHPHTLFLQEERLYQVAVINTINPDSVGELKNQFVITPGY